MHLQGNFPTPLSRALEDFDNATTIAVTAARPITPRVMMRAKGVSVTTKVHFLSLSLWVDSSSKAAFIYMNASCQAKEGRSHQDS